MKCLHAVCQGHINSLDFRDMGGLLDDAAGESGPRGAALPQSHVGSCDTYPVQDTGNRGGTSCAALSCTSFGPCQTALPLGQVGKSHGGVNLPPVLITSTMLTSALLLFPASQKKQNIDTKQKWCICLFIQSQNDMGEWRGCGSDSRKTSKRDYVRYYFSSSWKLKRAKSWLDCRLSEEYFHLPVTFSWRIVHCVCKREEKSSPKYPMNLLTW